MFIICSLFWLGDSRELTYFLGIYREEPMAELKNIEVRGAREHNLKKRQR